MSARRLLLVRHAPTTAVRTAAFGSDEPLDERGLAAATALAGSLGARPQALVSPALRTRQTAEALGLSEVQVRDALAEGDFGRWAGRTLADVHGEEPEAVTAWMADPEAAPHGGESLAAVLARVGAWLEELAATPGRTVAVTHGGVVKAAVVLALGAPPAAFWRIDVSPLSVTELSAHDGRWTVSRVNAALAPVTVPAARADGTATTAGWTA